MYFLFLKLCQQPYCLNMWLRGAKHIGWRCLPSFNTNVSGYWSYKKYLLLLCFSLGSIKYHNSMLHGDHNTLISNNVIAGVWSVFLCIAYNLSIYEVGLSHFNACHRVFPNQITFGWKDFSIPKILKNASHIANSSHSSFLIPNKGSKFIIVFSLSIPHVRTCILLK